MLRLGMVTLALVCAVFAETTVEPGDDTTGITAAPPITEFSLAFEHIQSTTNSIIFKWEAAVPDWMKILGYDITAAIKNSDSGSVMTYPPLPATEDYFEADDLVKDSIWDVCITSSVRNGTAANAEVVEIKECFESFTIPMIRPDSLIGLFCVIGVLVILVLIGYISWKCAVMKKEREEAEAAAAAEEEENEESKKDN